MTERLTTSFRLDLYGAALPLQPTSEIPVFAIQRQADSLPQSC